MDQNLRIKKSKGWKRYWPVWLLLGTIVVIVLAWLLFSSSSSAFNFGFPGRLSSIKSSDDRVNILLLGNGGGKHDGPDLTDSIIVASLNLKTNRVALISIPRDLWLDSIKSKVNTAYVLGEKKGNGLKFAEDKIDDILGIPIHYGVRLDFNGFSKAVDLVEGIDVDVPHTFDDFMYPIAGKEDDLCGYSEKEVDVSEDQAKQLNIKSGKQKIFFDPAGKIATDSANFDFACRFEHIHFNKGVSHMDGETALKFVRSRHAFGVEGSDFARSHRQQLVIQAFREKALSLQTLINPVKIAGLFGTFGDSFETDIPSSNFLEFYNLTKKIEETDSYVLGDLGDGKSLFTNPPPSDYGGAWVLVPQSNNFSEVMQFVKDALNDNLNISSPTPVGTPAKVK